MLYLYIVFVIMEVNMYICKSNSCETQQVFIHVYIAKIPYIYYIHTYIHAKYEKKLGFYIAGALVNQISMHD